MQTSIPKGATALLCLCVATKASAAVAWKPCTLDGVQGKSECTTISVAEDRAKPNGRRIALRVARLLPLSQDAARNPVFVLQGGPEQSAVKLAKFYGGCRGSFTPQRKATTRFSRPLWSRYARPAKAP